MNEKKQILKLNSNFFPIGVEDWQSVLVSIMAKRVYPVDVYYSRNEDGEITGEIESFYVVKDWKEWENLEIRPCDDFIQGATKKYRLPPIVVCSAFDKIRHKKYYFPTNENICRRDKNICQYSGKPLKREDVSIDHIIPKSRGGKNSWENLVTCDKKLNIWKGNRTPKECGLKLIRQPLKPINGLVFDCMREEWNIFVGGKFEIS